MHGSRSNDGMPLRTGTLCKSFSMSLQPEGQAGGGGGEEGGGGRFWGNYKIQAIAHETSRPSMQSATLCWTFEGKDYVNTHLA